MPDRETARSRQIRSYVLRQGRLTHGQSKALQELWPVYGCNLQTPFEALFDRPAPVCLEIGFGMGDSLATQAAASPDENFIGVEVHRPGVGHLLMTLAEGGIDNVRVFAEDSLDVVSTVLPDDSLARVQVFFPDPWPKKKHHKRRLVNEAFIGLLQPKLKRGGIIHIATDWSEYAQAVEQCFSACPQFRAVQAPRRPVTRFEQRGLRMGHTITDLAYRLDE